MPTWAELATVTVRVALTTAPFDAAPVWVDITDRVLTVDRAQPIDIQSGRQSELDDDEPTRMTLTLLNDDDAFTSGNTLSPYYPYWREGRRLQVRETVGRKTIVSMDGYVEMPEVAFHTVPADQLVTVTVVDRLTRLGTGRTFRSTFTEYVRHAGSSKGLVGYWPMTEPSGAFYDISGGLSPLALQTDMSNFNPADVTGLVGVTGLAYADASLLPHDDAKVPRLDFEYGDFFGIPLVTRYVRLDQNSISMTIASGQVVTVVAWLSLEDRLTTAEYTMPMAIGFGGSNLSYLKLCGASSLTVDVADQNRWILTTNFNSFTYQNVLEADAFTLDPAVPRPVAVRIDWGGGTVELWDGTMRAVGNLTGTPPAQPLVLHEIAVPSRWWAGPLGHIQLYVGAATDFTFDDFLAQINAASTALDRQRTDERIATLAAYAGIDPGDLELDEGVARMPAALLAGKTFTTAATAANSTERGRLFCDGSRIVFHNRTRGYNI